jgi:DegV family protein with EDD domain
MRVHIVTDSTSDLPEEVIVGYGITVIPLYINIGEESYLDGIELSREEFYRRLPDYGHHPTTSAPAPGMFARAYQRLVAEGAEEILSIHISSSLSNAVNVARLTAQSVSDVPVTVFDAGQVSLGTGILVLAAAEAAAEGRSAKEIVALLEGMTERTYTFAALDTLKFLRRSGRLTRFQSGLGTVLRVKPILKMNRGEVGMERVRTRRRAFERLIELVNEVGPLEHLSLVHTHAPERVEELRKVAQHVFPGDQVPFRSEVTPVIGAHIGPGAVGFVCVAKSPSQYGD